MCFLTQVSQRIGSVFLPSVPTSDTDSADLHLERLSKLKESIGFKVCMIGVGFIFFVTIFWLTTSDKRSSIGSIFDENRDYKLVPFDMVDASIACEKQVAQNYGESLVRTYLDSHSTRFDPVSSTYKIFIHALQGTEKDYTEDYVHCFVDPNDYVISHYQAFSSKKDSLMKRALSFFD